MPISHQIRLQTPDRNLYRRSALPVSSASGRLASPQSWHRLVRCILTILSVQPTKALSKILFRNWRRTGWRRRGKWHLRDGWFSSSQSPIYSHELNVLPVAHSLTAYDEGIERIRSSLDTVHNVFTRLVQHLTVRRNAACAVNRLPLEILQNIFEFAGESGMDWKTNQAITGVCSFWRNAALNDPRMWCCIDSYLAGKSYATLAVERSCSAPLSLLSSQPNSRTRKRWPKQWIADLAEAQASRLRALDITIFVKPTTGPSLHSPIFTCAAPMLERLEVGVRNKTVAF